MQANGFNNTLTPPPSVSPPIADTDTGVTPSKRKKTPPPPESGLVRRVQQRVQHVQPPPPAPVQSSADFEERVKQLERARAAALFTASFAASSVARTVLPASPSPIVPAASQLPHPPVSPYMLNKPTQEKPKPQNGLALWVNNKGERYQGEWSNGTLKKGIMHFTANGAEHIYEGEFDSQLRPHGTGKIRTPENKMIMEGKFENGSVEGTQLKGDLKYQGTFRDLNLHGKGSITHILTNQVISEGEYVHGKLHGKGVKKEGSLTEKGDFKEGLLDGQCVRIDSDYQSEGSFSKGELHGFGICKSLKIGFLKKIGVDEADSFIGFFEQGNPKTGKGFYLSKTFVWVQHYGEIYDFKMLSGVGVYQDPARQNIVFFGIIKDSKPYHGEYHSLYKMVEGKLEKLKLTISEETFLAYLKKYLSK